MKYIILTLVTLFQLGCVTQKQYDQLLAEKVKLEKQKLDLENEVEIFREQLADLSGVLAVTKEEGQVTQEKLDSLENAHADLRAEYNKLDTYYNNLLSNSGKLSRDLEEQRKNLLELRAENEALAADLDEREARVSELEKVLNEKDSAVQALKDVVSNALLSFKENDLSVEIKNGKVYVSLAEDLLFGSGSVVVDAKGSEALTKLGEVLTENPDINVMVEGHTDDVPISKTSKYMKDNWDLSVMRATSIVRILTKSGVSPDRVIASGRGEHLPVAENDTKENKALNRRTEIILTPKLDELFSILESD